SSTRRWCSTVRRSSGASRTSLPPSWPVTALPLSPTLSGRTCRQGSVAGHCYFVKIAPRRVSSWTTRYECASLSTTSKAAALSQRVGLSSHCGERLAAAFSRVQCDERRTGRYHDRQLLDQPAQRYGLRMSWHEFRPGGGLYADPGIQHDLRLADANPEDGLAGPHFRYDWAGVRPWFRERRQQVRRPAQHHQGPGPDRRDPCQLRLAEWKFRFLGIQGRQAECRDECVEFQ